tara:strand:- start:68 stop:631 length:564 start_codon:yes stop_codon:yes gene_type:complete
MEQRQLTESSLEDLDLIQDVPQDVLSLLPYLNSNQRAYLVARPVTPSRSKAAAIVGVTEGTVYTWRSTVPGFREAEEAIVDAKGDSSLQLARALYKGAMPGVAQRQITQALRDDQGLSARELAAQQQARAAVAKGSGMEDQPPVQDPVRSLLAEFYALALRHVPPLPAPTVTVEGTVADLLPPEREQ